MDTLKQRINDPFFAKTLEYYFSDNTLKSCTQCGNDDTNRARLVIEWPPKIDRYFEFECCVECMTLMDAETKNELKQLITQKLEFRHIDKMSIPFLKRFHPFVDIDWLLEQADIVSTWKDVEIFELLSEHSTPTFVKPAKH